LRATNFRPAIIRHTAWLYLRFTFILSANKFEPYKAPVYFKSRFLSPDDNPSIAQQEIEAALAATGLFMSGAPEPAWDAVKAALNP
jgi:hypothetical protein